MEMELIEMMEINWKRSQAFGANPRTQREKDQVVSKLENQEKHQQAQMVVMYKWPKKKMKILKTTVQKKLVEEVTVKSYSSS